MKKHPFCIALAAGVVLTLSPWRAPAQAPVTIYYTGNDVVKKLTPPGPATIFANLPAFTSPQGLAFDSSGNLFVAGGGNVTKITPAGVVSLFANLPPGSFGGYGIAIDAADNLYVGGAATVQIVKITPGGVVSIYATLTTGTTGLAIDGVGNLYKLGGDNTVKMIPAGGGPASIYATLPGNNLYGLAFDSFGNLYASDLTSVNLYKIPPGGGSYTTFGTLIAGSDGLAFDYSGNLYAAHLFADAISRVTASGTASVVGTSLSGPRYLAFKPGSLAAVRAAGFSTAIPDGTGNFAALSAASLSGVNAAFHGAGSDGQQGIYRGSVSIPGNPVRVVDTATAIPGGTGNFTSFIPPNPISPAIDGTRVAFFGAGSAGQQGIYVSDSAIPGNPVKIANAVTAIPGGVGNFTAFPTDPSLSGDYAVFAGHGSGGQQGIYGGSVTIPGNPVRVADTATAIPGGVGNFTSFIPGNPVAPAIDGASVAFFGAGSAGQQGIYTASVTIPGNPVRVVDTASAIPDGVGDFTSFIAGNPGPPAIDGTRVAFFGAGNSGQQGIYIADSTIPGNPVKIANATTAIPGGTGTFTGFGDVSLSAVDAAFLGFGSGGQQGIYALTGGSLVKVVDLTDVLNGRAIVSLKFARTGLSGDRVAFQATFADGSQGVYTTSVVAPFALLVTAVEKVGNDFRVSCTSEVGKSYELQSRLDLAAGEWASIPGTTTSGTGGTLQITATNAFSEPRQFYRVKQLP
jgi:hypothetical protein